MRSAEAEKKICPFMFAVPNTAMNLTPEQNCISFRCMAWELTSFQAVYKDRKSGEQVEVTDNGYCALIRQEAVEGFVMPQGQKARAW